MTPNSLRAQYLGKAINVDYENGVPFPKSQPYQCWDLADRYSLDNGWGQVTTGDGQAEGVYNLFEAPLPQHYIRIPYTPGFVARLGDLAVWKPNVPGITGSAGHIAVTLGGDASGVSVLEQNNPKPYVTEARHPYAGVAGVLRPISLEGGDMYNGKSAQDWAQAATDATSVAETRARYLAQVVQAAGVNPDHPLGQPDVDAAVAYIGNVNQQLGDAETQIKAQGNSIDLANKQIAALQTELSAAEAVQAVPSPETPSPSTPAPTTPPAASGTVTAADLSQFTLGQLLTAVVSKVFGK